MNYTWKSATIEATKEKKVPNTVGKLLVDEDVRELPDELCLYGGTYSCSTT